MEKLTIAREWFCCLLQFAYEHNADIIKELQVPEILENNNNMIKLLVICSTVIFIGYVGTINFNKYNIILFIHIYDILIIFILSNIKNYHN